jgi:hypothetical protein
MATACGASPVPSRPALSQASSPAPSGPAPRPRSCARTAPLPCDDGSPRESYETDIRPILEQRCFRCHSGDGDAAESHDFSRLEVVRAQRADIADEVRSCSMPPPGVALQLQLTDAETSTLLRWVACGGS